MSKDLKEIAIWLNVNKDALNLLKTDFLFIWSRRRIATFDSDIEFSLFNTDVMEVKSTACLLGHVLVIGNLRNHNGDAKDNVE